MSLTVIFTAEDHNGKARSVSMSGAFRVAAGDQTDMETLKFHESGKPVATAKHVGFETWAKLLDEKNGTGVIDLREVQAAGAKGAKAKLAIA